MKVALKIIVGFILVVFLIIASVVVCLIVEQHNSDFGKEELYIECKEDLELINNFALNLAAETGNEDILIFISYNESGEVESARYYESNDKIIVNITDEEKNAITHISEILFEGWELETILVYPDDGYTFYWHDNDRFGYAYSKNGRGPKYFLYDDWNSFFMLFERLDTNWFFMRASRLR